jgi:hypothetical protein
MLLGAQIHGPGAEFMKGKDTENMGFGVLGRLARGRRPVPCLLAALSTLMHPQPAGCRPHADLPSLGRLPLRLENQSTKPRLSRNPNLSQVEASSARNGIGLVKLMGRQSGFIAMQASMAAGGCVRRGLKGACETARVRTC